MYNISIEVPVSNALEEKTLKLLESLEVAQGCSLQAGHPVPARAADGQSLTDERAFIYQLLVDSPPSEVLPYNILIQFPGTSKEYAYTSFAKPVLGQRCVVPTMVKKDGMVALSIATVVGFGPETVGAKPVIALLDSALIAAAQEFVLKLEAVPALEAPCGG